MASESIKTTSIILLSVFLIPTLMLLLGYFLIPPPSDPSYNIIRQISYIPLFLGLFCLGAGVILKIKKTASFLIILGWGLFASFWATMPSFLYLSEGGDIFNAGVCVIGVYVLIYVAYHEWLSLKRHEYPSCLYWIAGGTFLAGIIYFTIDVGIPVLKNWLIETVAAQSAGLMNLFGLPASPSGSAVLYNDVPITIIFACTAIQSMVLFVGMIGALPSVCLKRKLVGIGVTVIPIYFLNLIRNAGVIFLFGSRTTSFELAHNVIGKIGSLVALIVLLFITFKLLPELYDVIMGVIDLPKRNGPVEQVFHKILGTKKHAAR